MTLVDLATANEFALALARELPSDARDTLADDLAERHARALVLTEHPSEETIAELLGLVFGVRSHANALLASVGTDALADLVARLRDSDDRAAGLAHAASLPFDTTITAELVSELIHLLHPATVPLLRRWVLDAEEETGALCLLLEEPAVAWDHEDPIALATAVRAELEEAGLVRHELWHFDVFLAGVYGVYCATVIRLRMTKEFGGLLPGLGELMGRMLGVRGGVYARRR